MRNSFSKDKRDAQMKVIVKKASGRLEPYSREKIIRSSLRAGLNRNQAENVATEIERNLYDGIETREIYGMVLDAVRGHDSIIATRYTLKRAMMSLGPSGFPFETFISKILEAYGYTTTLRSKIRGRCVDHEVDVIAEKKEGGRLKRCMVECKYHNAAGIYTGLKEALYTYARFLDLGEGSQHNLSERFDEAWLVSNTKCSYEAKTYAKCKGLKVLAWNYPPRAGLEKLIQDKRLYPITIIEKVTGDQLERFSRANLMLVKDLIDADPHAVAKSTGIPLRKISNMKREASKY